MLRSNAEANVGVYFSLSSMNALAYLTARTPVRPRMTRADLRNFLDGLEYYDAGHQRLISSSPEFVLKFQRAAGQVRRQLPPTDFAHDDVRTLDPDVLTTALEPLRSLFHRYAAFVLPVGGERYRHALERFARETAMAPGHGILVLIPDIYDERSFGVLEPNDGTAQAVREVDRWPGAVFVLRSGSSAFAPLDEAYGVVSQLSGVFSRKADEPDVLAAADRIIDGVRERRAERTPRRRILHLSDLHFGTDRSAQTQVFLQANVRELVPTIDHLVITGDLFDHPKKRHAQAFKNFSDQLRLLGFERSIVVPENHDQRFFGNSLLGFGKRLRQVADLEWSSLFVDEARHLLFICFDSARTGNLARGTVDGEQLLKVATDLDVEDRDGRFDGWLRIALVHHHPYPYESDNYRERPIIDPQSWIGREEFVGMDQAENFLTWCAARGVSLILHGHKHLPRLIIDKIETQDGYAGITTAACGSSLGANNSQMSFNIVEWSPVSKSWSVDFKLDRGDGQGFRSAYIQAQSVL